MTQTISKLVAAVVLFGAVAAFAQPYPITPSSVPYQTLTGAGVQTATLIAQNSNAKDDGYADIPLGFSFPYYGVNYTTVHVDSNGFLMFGGGSQCMTSACLGAGAMPSTLAEPQGVIAPWWDDLEGNLPTSDVKYLKTSSDIEIEWFDWGPYSYSGTYTVSFKVKLSASGMIQIHYGPKSAGATGATATMGFENLTGSLGAPLLPCAASGANCTMTEWIPNTLFTIGQPVAADIVVPSVSIANLVVDGSNIATFDVTPTFLNYGQTAATGPFAWKAYLSTDRFLDGADRLVYTSPANVTLTATGTAGATTTATGAASSGTALAPGQYYVLVEADTTNTVVEASETNNVGSTANYFVNGLDLVATGISGPAQSGPGNPIVVVANWFNQGTNPAGMVNYRVLLSTDALVSTNDFVLYSGTRAVSGGETINDSLSFNVPTNVPGGDFYYILQIDPLNTIVEANENNNVFVSSGLVTMKQADLVNTATDFLDPVTGASTRVGYFGQPAKARVSVSNIGGANATNFKVAVVISTDASLSLLGDTIAIEQTVALVAQGTSQTIDIPFTLPLKDKANVAFASGAYFLFTIVDSTSVITELSETNNALMIAGPVQLRAPAPDLTVTRLEAAASGAVGEVIPVLRTLKNIGNVDAPPVKYRFFASANATIDPLNDVPLPIVSGTMTSIEGTITLAVGAADTATELVKLPASMPPGVYYLGCVIDTGNAVNEIDETNNSLASNTVQVAPSSLEVSTLQLPDAVVDRPFSYRLTAHGEQGLTSTWTLDPSQGTLPMGMSLDTDGLIHGTPVLTTVTAFTVVVSNGGRDADGRLVLRVLPPTTQVEITTTSVPAVVNTPAQKYEFSLGAAGGVKPYAWKVIAGTLPQNLTLTNDGVITGNPKLGLAEGTNKVTVEVTDSLGTRASQALSVRVVAPGSIVFTSLALSDGLVGNQYAQDIVVLNADHTPLAKPLVWTRLGELPDGLSLTPATELISIEGTPLRAGSYSFTMTVEDAKGRSDTAEFTILVYPARFKVSANGIPVVIRPGDMVSFNIVANTKASPRFSLSSGQLPLGLALAPDGTVSGTVTTDKSEGNFNFVVEATDDTGASGLGAFNLEVKRVVKAGGCSTSGGGMSLWMLAVLIPLAIRRLLGASTSLRVRSLAQVAALALAVLPLVAQAQTYQVVGPTPLANGYVPLNGSNPGPTVITICGSTYTNCIYRYQGTSVPITFPFNYFGQSVSSITMTNHGYLVLSGDDSAYANLGIPGNSSYLASFLAPWWDDIATPTVSSAAFRYQTFGVAPNRYMVFEWNQVAPSAASTPKFSMEVILYEGTGQIRFAYGPTGPSTGSASVGIQASVGVGVAALSCTTSLSGTCSNINFPANQAIDFFLPADLTVSSVSGDQTGYSGVAYHANAVVKNIGGRVATGVVVRFYLSTDAILDATDLQIGDSAAVDVAPGAEALVTSVGLIPASAVFGTYFVIAKVDPTDAIVEQNENNNVGTPTLMSVGMPTADLVVSSVSGPATAMPGGTIAAYRKLENVGNSAAGAFKYTWYLSDNSVVTISDVKLDPVGSVAGLAAGANDANTDMIVLPATLAAGRYWLGVCVNYDPGAGGFGIPEITQVNNCATAAPGSGMIVSSGQLAVITASLPTATQYSPYGLRLQAAGGDGSYLWALAGGALPPGISLAPTGDLQGNPATAGTFAFDAKVTSGGAEKTASLSLSVAPGSLPLAVVDQDLPAAEFSRAYLANLVAVGGKPPYIWTLKQDNRLPAGLALSTDGQIEGRANEGGDFLFSVVCTDSTMIGVGKDLKLKVVSPATLHIATGGLPIGYIKQPYLQALQAVGGKGPYTWSLVKFQQLAENATEEPGPVLGDGKMAISALPESFGLKIEPGVNGPDHLKGTPKLAGLYSLTLKAVDTVGAEDYTQLLLRVSYVEGLAIVTTALPDAFVGHEYTAKIVHNGGKDAIVNFSVPCIKERSPTGTFVCAGVDPATHAPDPLTQIPPGLVLAADGTIAGTALLQATDADTVYSFLVKVTDENGRQDIRGLSIKVQKDFGVTKSGGCSGTGLDPSSLTLLLAAGLAVRLRRRRG